MEKDIVTEIINTDFKEYSEGDFLDDVSSTFNDSTMLSDYEKEELILDLTTYAHISQHQVQYGNKELSKTNSPIQYKLCRAIALRTKANDYPIEKLNGHNYGSLSPSAMASLIYLQKYNTGINNLFELDILNYPFDNIVEKTKFYEQNKLDTLDVLREYPEFFDMDTTDIQQLISEHLNSKIINDECSALISELYKNSEDPEKIKTLKLTDNEVYILFEGLNDIRGSLKPNEDTIQIKKSIYELLTIYNTGTIKSCIKEITIKYDMTKLTLEFDDLFQMGAIGLQRAIDKYDHKRGNKLQTYAIWWIKQAIQRGMDNTMSNIRIPIHVRDLTKKYNKFIYSFQNENSYFPSDEDIMDNLDIDEEKLELIRESIKKYTTASLNSPIDNNARTSRGYTPEQNEKIDSVPSNINVEQEVLNNLQIEEQRRILEEVMHSCLNDREIAILESRFGLNGKTPKIHKELSKEYSVTRQRTSEIEQTALRKLKIAYKLRKFAGIED